MQRAMQCSLGQIAISLPCPLKRIGQQLCNGVELGINGRQVGQISFDEGLRRDFLLTKPFRKGFGRGKAQVVHQNLFLIEMTLKAGTISP